MGCYVNTTANNNVVGFNLGSVGYNSTGTAAYYYSMSGTETTAGVNTIVRTTNGLQSSGLILTSTSNTSAGVFTMSTQLSNLETGVGTFSINNGGSYNWGTYNLSQINLSESANATVVYNQSDIYSYNPNGTFTESGSAAGQSLSVAGTYTGTTYIDDSLTRFSTANYSMNKFGSVNNGVFSLGCYVLNSSMTGTYSTSTFTDSTEKGTVNSFQTASSLTTVGIGTTNSTSAASYSYSSKTLINGTMSGGFSQSTYQAGSFNNGGFSLSSFGYSQSCNGSWTSTGSDQSFSSGTTTNTRNTVYQTTPQSGSGNAPSSNTITTKSTNTFSSSYQDSFVQSGTTSSYSSQDGSYINGTYNYFVAESQSSGNQSGYTFASGADTLVAQTSTKTLSFSSQGKIGPYGPAGTATTTGTGSFNGTSQATLNSVSNDSWSQSYYNSSSYANYQNAALVNGSWSLYSINSNQSSTSLWSAQTSTATSYKGTTFAVVTGTGSTNTTSTVNSPFGPMTKNAYATGSYSQFTSTAYSGFSQSTATADGSSSNYQATIGSYINGVASLSCVVYNSSNNQSATFDLSGSSMSLSTTAINFTSLSNSYGSSSGTVTNTGAISLSCYWQTGQGRSSQTASEMFGQGYTSASRTRSYQAGTFGASGYNLSSVAYTQYGSGSSYSYDSVQAVTSGTDSWSGLTVTQSGVASVQSGNAAQSSMYSTYFDRYVNSGGTTTVQHGTSNSTFTEYGSCGNGGYSFKTYSFDSKALQTTVSVLLSGSTSTAWGTDSWASYSGQSSAAGASNFTNISGQNSYAGGSDSYSQQSAQYSTQTLVSTASYTLHQFGSYSLGSWNLSSVAYNTNSGGIQLLFQTTTSSNSGAFSSYSGGSSIRSGLGTSTGTFSVSTSSSYTTSTNYHTASGSYSNYALSTNVQISTAAYTYSESGYYNRAAGYNFVVINQTSFGIAGTLQSYASGVSVSNAYDSVSTTNGTGYAGALFTANGALQWTNSTNSNASRTLNSVNTTSYQYVNSTYNLLERSTGSNSMSQVGVFASGSYMFNSSLITSTSTDSYSMVQTNSTMTTGSSNGLTIQAMSYGNTNASYALTTYALSLQTSLRNYFSVSTSTSLGSFTESSFNTTQQSGIITNNVSEVGVYAQGTFSFRSVAVQATNNSVLTVQQFSVGDFLSVLTSTGISTGGNAASNIYNPHSPGNTYQSAGTFNSFSVTSYVNTSTQWSHNTSVYTDNQKTRYSMYQLGSMSNGSTSLSSISVKQSSVDTSVTTNYSVAQQQGAADSMTAVFSVAKSTGSVPNLADVGNNGYTNIQSYLSYSNTTAMQVSLTTEVSTIVTKSRSYQSGSVSNRGTYSLNCIVFSSMQNSTQSNQLVSTQSGTQNTGNVSSSLSLSTMNNYPASTPFWLGQMNSGGVRNQGNQTSQQQFSLLTLNTYLNTQSKYFAVGCYNGTTNNFALSSVNYQVSSFDSYNSSQISTSTVSDSNQLQNNYSSAYTYKLAGAAGAQINSSNNALYSSQSWTQYSWQLQTQSGYAGTSFKALGTYATTGGFSFSSLVYNSWSLGVSSTQSTTLDSSVMTYYKYNAGTCSNSGVDGNGNLNWTAAFAYATKTAGMTVVQQSGFSSGTDTTFSYANLYEAGTFSSYCLSLTSVVYSQVSSEPVTSWKSSLTTQAVTQSNSSYNSAFCATIGGTSNGTIATTNTEFGVNNLTTSLTSYSSSMLYEAGAMSNGQYSFSSVAYTTGGLSSYAQTNTQIFNGNQTQVTSGNQAMAYSTGTQLDGVMTVNSLSSSRSTLLSTGLYSYSITQQGSYNQATNASSLSCVVFSETSSSNQYYKTASQVTVTVSTSGKINSTGNDYLKTSLNSWQTTRTSLYAAGTVTGGQWSLSSYNMSASNSSGVNQTKTQNSSNTVNSATDSRGNYYSGWDRTTLSQSTYQYQSSSIAETGKYSSSGGYTLSVTLRLSGENTFSSSNTNLSSFTGESTSMNGNDSLSATSSGVSTYSFRASGTYSNNNWSINGTLRGGSTGSSLLTDSGISGETTYSHTDNWIEQTTYYARGNYNSANSNNASGGWAYTSYNSANSYGCNLSPARA